MRVLTGTSGFSYDEWHGRFYPADLPANARLTHYCLRLPSVEINNTFYQTPKAELLERWRDAVGPEFRFALKAPRRVTHVQRLKGAQESLAYFWSAASVLGEKLGPVLFQLPPFAKKDLSVLADFLAALPAGLRPAFEFRNPSWFDDEVYALLSSRGAALCAGDSDEDARSPPLVATADFGYLRLRAPSYDAAGLRAWRDRIAAQPWERAYVYLKHEVLGPDYATFLAAIAEGGPEPPFPEALPAPVAVPYALEKKKRAKKPAPAAVAAPAKDIPTKRPAKKKPAANASAKNASATKKSPVAASKQPARRAAPK
ncbi:MAG TPA: DUF72 domain-containing protein [Polyangiaceae bacterium]|nr:DUF72 domain-containing protein [Polyangiaceae bacterium]